VWGGGLLVVVVVAGGWGLVGASGLACLQQTNKPNKTNQTKPNQTKPYRTCGGASRQRAARSSSSCSSMPSSRASSGPTPSDTSLPTMADCSHQTRLVCVVRGVCVCGGGYVFSCRRRLARSTHAPTPQSIDRTSEPIHQPQSAHPPATPTHIHITSTTHSVWSAACRSTGCAACTAMNAPR
jgi:hypothetical protein